MTFINIVLLAGLMLLAISLRRTYGQVPEKELKRRARAGDPAAYALHKVAVYGPSLRALLAIIIMVLTSLFLIALADATQTWFAVLVGGSVLWLGFLWLPAQDATRASVWLAKQVAPALAWVLQYIHPFVNRVQLFVRKYRPLTFHTGLYDKDDLDDLFRRQKVQSDNRVDQQTLEIVEHALHFGDKKVGDILTPRRVVKAVSMDDTSGPILMSDLHDSGFSRFPVFQGKKDNLVGILYLRDLVRSKAGGSVHKLMHAQVCYVHEDQPLGEALQAILKTHQQLYVVVNSFEEYVGIVTIEDIMEEIVGKQIVDEFDQYEDLRAVAKKMAAKDHEEHAESPHENIQEVLVDPEA